MTWANSQATSAVTMGLRGNANAMPVAISRSVTNAAAAHDRYAVRAPSVSTKPLNPTSAASRASAWISGSGAAVTIMSSFIASAGMSLIVAYRHRS